MLDRLYPILALLVLMVVGFARVERRFRKEKKELALAKEFLREFQEYIKSHGRDEEIYEWLTENSNEIQSLLGQHGYMTFKYGNMVIERYSIIPNHLRQIKRDFGSDLWGRNSIFDENLHSLIDDIIYCLTASFGSKKSIISQLSKERLNPIKLFSQGIATIIESPVYIFKEFRLLPKKTSHRIVNSKIFIFITALVGIISFLAATVTIILGGPEAIQKLWTLWSNQ